MRILCFGDSNTYGYDPRGAFGGRYPAESRWVNRLAQMTGWELLNTGENGREIPRRAGELARFRQLLRECQPLDGLILLLGTNDLLQGASPETAACRMAALLEPLPLAADRILLIAPPPMALGAWVESEALVDASKQLSGHYAALAQRLGIRFADAGAWQVEPAFDGVHFTENGHRAFAAGLSGVLADWRAAP